MSSSNVEELQLECVVCQRKFKSGKALGGHKRMHNKKNDNDDVNDEEEVATHCRICGKGFPSEKSLFGHMRSHPERPWRGIHPPPPLTWSLTGPRGGARPAAYSSVVVPGMDRASRDAVLDLMMLKASKRSTTVFKLLLEEEEEERRRRRRKEYSCSVCNKSFASYQALGGHRSSHNKNPTAKPFLAFDLNHSPPH